MTHPPAEETANLLTSDQEDFAHWLSLPMSERVPQLQRDWARKRGISREATLSEWKRLPAFRALLRVRRLEIAEELTGEAIHAWRKLIRRGKWEAIEAALEYAGILGKDPIPTTTVNVGVQSINPEEARRLLELAEASAAARVTDHAPGTPPYLRERLGEETPEAHRVIRPLEKQGSTEGEAP